MFEPVSISISAAKEIKHMMEHKNIPEGYGLRVGVKGGSGCGGGIGYMLGFDKPKEDDLSYISEGVQVHIEKKQTMYLVGLEVDFYDGADERGFTFEMAED